MVNTDNGKLTIDVCWAIGVPEAFEITNILKFAAWRSRLAEAFLISTEHVE